MVKLASLFMRNPGRLKMKIASPGVIQPACISYISIESQHDGGFTWTGSMEKHFASVDVRHQ
jgi:hypothetical protein